MRFLLVLLICQVANADYNSAVRDYESKSYDKAFAEFKRLAELGDADSQRNLAAMHARGEATPKDLVAAYGWAAVAADQDKSGAEKFRQALAKKMTPEELAAGLQQELTLRAQYGQQALMAELMPVSNEQAADCSVDVTGDATPIETIAPRYPMDAILEGADAVVHVRFYLTATGTTSRAKITKIEANDRALSGSLRKQFAKSVMSAIAKWRFQPAAEEALREVPREYQIAFRSQTGNSAPPRAPEEDPETIAQAVDADDTSRMHQIASHLKQRYASPAVETTALRIKRSDPGSDVNAMQAFFDEERSRRQKYIQLSNRLFLRTAINGHADGQYDVARRLLTGDRCEKDQAKGLIWLSLAAQQGQPDAQYLLSHRLAAGNGMTLDSRKALTWLKAAAESGHARAGVELAMHMLTQESGSPDAALKLLPAETDEDDIGVLEVKALAAALNGQFTEASAYQESVVAIADELEFSKEQRQQWLTQFRAGQLPLLASSQ